MHYSLLTVDCILILSDGDALFIVNLQRSSLSETAGANVVTLLSERGFTSDISS